jgi:hypothetical protein
MSCLEVEILCVGWDQKFKKLENFQLYVFVTRFMGSNMMCFQRNGDWKKISLPIGHCARVITPFIFLLNFSIHKRNFMFFNTISSFIKRE